MSKNYENDTLFKNRIRRIFIGNEHDRPVEIWNCENGILDPQYANVINTVTALLETQGK